MNHSRPVWSNGNGGKSYDSIKGNRFATAEKLGSLSGVGSQKDIPFIRQGPPKVINFSFH